MPPLEETTQPEAATLPLRPPPAGEREEGARLDAALVARYLAGDGAALEELFDRYETVLFHFLIGILKDHHQAEDALQETWCRALEHLDGVDTSRLRGWLFTVAYHQAMLIKRKHKERPTPADHEALADPAPSPVLLAQDRDDLEKALALLDRLSPAQREVVRQRIFEGKPFRDIAAAMNCPLNTALARMHEAVNKLRRLWGPDYA